MSTTLWISTSLVTLAEMGDKTQLLAFMLAVKFKKPTPIILAIFIATLINHAGAAWIGHFLASYISNDVLTWILGLSFLAMAIWILIPDKMDDSPNIGRYGVFVTTLIAFFLAEMGDKTQVATVALAAKYADIGYVILGTTLGMMIANVPAVFLGQQFSERLPLKWMHRGLALLFAILGMTTLMHVWH